MIKRFIIIGSLFLSLNKAYSQSFEDTQDLHVYSHLGLSYIITMTTYGFTKKVFHLEPEEKWQALLFAIVFSTTVGIMRQVIVAPPGVPVNTNGIKYNAIGNVLAGATIVVLDF